MFKLRLGTKIMLGLVLGALTGLILGEKAMFLQVGGDLFIKIVKIVVVPLVLASIANGVLACSDMKSFGRIGLKTMLLFFGSAIVSVTLGMVVAQVMQPGQGFQMAVDTSGFKAPEVASISDMILNLVPSNPIGSMADGKVLQVIVFAILVGIATLMAGDKGKPVATFIESLAEVMFKFVNMVVATAPYGVFCLMAPTTGKYGLEVLLPLAKVILSLGVAVLVMILVVYPLVLKFIARVPLKTFVGNCQEPALVAFSAALSSAAFPFSMKAQENMKVSKKVREFVIPVGMTMNMNGTSMYLAIAATFIANVYGMELSMNQMFVIVITGILASVGATTVPMAGFIMLSMVVTAAGLPVEGLALVAGIERILDMLRTSANVIGDNVVAVTVASLENEIDCEATDWVAEPA